MLPKPFWSNSGLSMEPPQSLPAEISLGRTERQQHAYMCAHRLFKKWQKNETGKRFHKFKLKTNLLWLHISTGINGCALL